MTTLVRLAGLTIALVLLLVVGNAVGGRWVRDQDERIRTETVASRSHQFEKLVRELNPGALPWDAETKKRIADAFGADAVVDVPAGPSAESGVGGWNFVYSGSSSDNLRSIRVDISPPSLVRVVGRYQRASVVLILLAVALLILLGSALVLALRRARENEDSPSESRAADTAGLSSLTRLARVSVEQGVALEREKNERLRIQEDLNFQQVLLNRSLEEKIRLGHDLHDGIIQALYATGLTLEAAKSSITSNVPLASEQLEMALNTLNTTIRDVRSYILGLSPEQLRHQSFEESVRSIAQTLGAGSGVKYDIVIDDGSASRLSEDQATDLLQIVREGISNGIRHGHALQMVVRLHENNGEICLLIQDNGNGFEIGREVRGNGLSNIEARAARLGANLRCTSAPGTGTRLTLTLQAKTLASV